MTPEIDWVSILPSLLAILGTLMFFFGYLYRRNSSERDTSIEYYFSGGVHLVFFLFFMPIFVLAVLMALVMVLIIPFHIGPIPFNISKANFGALGFAGLILLTVTMSQIHKRYANNNHEYSKKEKDAIGLLLSAVIGASFVFFTLFLENGIGVTIILGAPLELALLATATIVWGHIDKVKKYVTFVDLDNYSYSGELIKDHGDALTVRIGENIGRFYSNRIKWIAFYDHPVDEEPVVEKTIKTSTKRKKDVKKGILKSKKKRQSA